jgi:hypothetical protein
MPVRCPFPFNIRQLPTQHSTAQHNTAQHSTAQHNAAQHNTTQHTQHSTAQHSTAQHSTAQHSTAQHSTTQHNTTQHNTTQHNTTQHNTTQHNTTQQWMQRKSIIFGESQLGVQKCCKNPIQSENITSISGSAGSSNEVQSTPCPRSNHTNGNGET